MFWYGSGMSEWYEVKWNECGERWLGAKVIVLFISGFVLIVIASIQVEHTTKNVPQRRLRL